MDFGWIESINLHEPHAINSIWDLVGEVLNNDT